MKKLMRIMVIVLALSFLFPVQAYAAPAGYKVVKITKKNAKKYFGVKKVKEKDASGNYTGYHYQLYSKLRKKGYYVFTSKKLTLNMSCKQRFRYSDGGRWLAGTYTDRTTLKKAAAYLPTGGAGNFDYKYAKMLSTKINKAKGKVIYVRKSNVIGVEKIRDSAGKVTLYKIKMKRPYNKKTLSSGHYDEKTGKYVVDYYYFTVNAWEWKYI